MKIKDFLKENNLSIGDNVKYLIEKLSEKGFIKNKDSIVKTLEERIGTLAKMSKSKGNTVDPSYVIEKYGADTVRLYILFSAPPEQDFEWIDSSIEGPARFLRRLYSFVLENKEKLLSSPLDLEKANKEIRYKTHFTIKKYLLELEAYQFNTMIASCFELFNTLTDGSLEKEEDLIAIKEGVIVLLKLLYPIVPHIASELLFVLNEDPFNVKFPDLDEKALIREEIEIPIQVNSKVRGSIKIKSSASEEEALHEALKHPNVKKYVEDKPIKKIIFVKGKLLNIIV